MRFRGLYLGLTLLLIATLALLGWTNPSYEKALEAKWYYLTGEYEEAYRSAKEAKALDPYNRMAITLMTRANLARDYMAYIKEALGYLERIETMAKHPPLTKPKQLRIKWMCEVAIESYTHLPRSPLGNKELEAQADRLHQKFQDLYRQLFGHAP